VLVEIENMAKVVRNGPVGLRVANTSLLLCLYTVGRGHCTETEAEAEANKDMVVTIFSDKRTQRCRRKQGRNNGYGAEEHTGRLQVPVNLWTSDRGSPISMRRLGHVEKLSRVLFYCLRHVHSSGAVEQHTWTDNLTEQSHRTVSPEPPESEYAHVAQSRPRKMRKDRLTSFSPSILTPSLP
jgi:hypothetical protein